MTTPVLKPRIAITMGDPAGIGPETIIKALQHPQIQNTLTPIIIGHTQTITRTARQLNTPQTFIQIPHIPSIDQPLHLQHSHETSTPPPIAIFQPPELPQLHTFPPGHPTPESGHASHTCVIHAINAALQKRVHAITTAPISKEAWYAAGHTTDPGHTELIARQTNTPHVRMMLTSPTHNLNVILQTIHIPLKNIPQHITTPNILKTIQIIHHHATQHNNPTPHIAICGLNPHASENNHIGNEEQTIITPAIQQAQAQGINATGPYPADTIFHHALNNPDIHYILAMYHDQGLIPIKTLDFHGAINVTLGPPILRTSPDHGTAYPIAGKNQANPNSLINALLYAAHHHPN